MKLIRFPQWERTAALNETAHIHSQQLNSSLRSKADSLVKAEQNLSVKIDSFYRWPEQCCSAVLEDEQHFTQKLSFSVSVAEKPLWMNIVKRFSYWLHAVILNSISCWSCFRLIWTTSLCDAEQFLSAKFQLSWQLLSINLNGFFESAQFVTEIQNSFSCWTWTILLNAIVQIFWVKMNHFLQRGWAVPSSNTRWRLSVKTNSFH